MGTLDFFLPTPHILSFTLGWKITLKNTASTTTYYLEFRTHFQHFDFMHLGIIPKNSKPFSEKHLNTLVNTEPVKTHVWRGWQL